MGKFLPLGGTRSHRATPNAKRGDHFLQADLNGTVPPCPMNRVGSVPLASSACSVSSFLMRLLPTWEPK
jgi:hypothetical protein